MTPEHIVPMTTLHDPESATVSVASSEAPARFERIAPLRHTVILALIIFGTAYMGMSRAPDVSTAPTRNHVPQYLVLLALDWLLFFYAWMGVRKHVSIRSLVNPRWTSPRGIAFVVAIAAAFLVVSNLALEGLKKGLALVGLSAVAENQHTLAIMAPHGAVEIVLWILLSITAGFTEEFVFRGYLQRQLIAITRVPALGLVLAGVLFGIGHLYQGWVSVVVISTYGILFGLFAMACKSLVPGILAHAAEDVISGLRLIK